MNYMYLMKKISESIIINNKEVSTIKKAISESNFNFNNEEYEEQIEKYLGGKSNDLYC